MEKNQPHEGNSFSKANSFNEKNLSTMVDLVMNGEHDYNYLTSFPLGGIFFLIGMAIFRKWSKEQFDHPWPNIIPGGVGNFYGALDSWAKEYGAARGV